jgi:hypothetical protein
MRRAPAASLAAAPEMMPAERGASAEQRDNDGNTAEGSQLRSLRGNAAKKLRTKE